MHLKLLFRRAAYWLCSQICRSNHRRFFDRWVFCMPLICRCWAWASLDWSYLMAQMCGFYLWIVLRGIRPFWECKDLAVDTGGCFWVEHLDHSIIVSILVIPTLDASLMIALIAVDTWVVFLALSLGWRTTDRKVMYWFSDALQLSMNQFISCFVCICFCLFNRWNSWFREKLDFLLTFLVLLWIVILNPFCRFLRLFHVNRPTEIS